MGRGITALIEKKRTHGNRIENNVYAIVHEPLKAKLDPIGRCFLFFFWLLTENSQHQRLVALLLLSIMNHLKYSYTLQLMAVLGIFVNILGL